MRRSVLGVLVVCLVVTFSASASDDGGLKLRRGKDDPLIRIIRVIQQTIRTFGDGLTGPRP